MKGKEGLGEGEGERREWGREGKGGSSGRE